MLRVSLCAVLCVAAPTAAAQAATVDVDAFGALVYTASPGEQNRVQITLGADAEAMTVTDPAVAVVPGAACAPVDEHRVTCTTATGAAPTRARAALGDGDDEATFSDPGGTITPLVADGGAGDDVLTGDAGTDVLTGGPGHDTLRGGDGRDVLIDGGTPGESDTFEGGEGTGDVVTYFGRADDVRLELDDAGADPDAGAMGEGDAVTGVETPGGGDGDDVLTGQAIGIMAGGDGDDVLRNTAPVAVDPQPGILRGGDGDDRLAGGPLPEELEGGAGRDRLTCGGGRDTVEGPEGGELLPRACERVRRTFGKRGQDSMTIPAFPERLNAVAARLRLASPAFYSIAFEPIAFRGRLSIDSRGRSLADAALRTPARESFAVRVRLTPAGRRLTGRKDGVVATLRLRSPAFPPLTWTVRLRR